MQRVLLLCPGQLYILAACNYKVNNYQAFSFMLTCESPSSLRKGARLELKSRRLNLRCSCLTQLVTTNCRVRISSEFSWLHIQDFFCPVLSGIPWKGTWDNEHLESWRKKSLMIWKWGLRSGDGHTCAYTHTYRRDHKIKTHFPIK